LDSLEGFTPLDRIAGKNGREMKEKVGLKGRELLDVKSLFVMTIGIPQARSDRGKDGFK
jgi:hypothetical protein